MNISVVIPVYNKESLVHKCLNSIDSQTISPSEVIIIDDGSSDNSLSIIKSHISQSSLEYRVVSIENSGVSNARNIGAKLARNKYIAFLDADDEWDITYLEKMINLISDYPNCVMYSCSHRVVNEKGVINFKSYFGKVFRGVVHDLCRASIKNSIVNSSKVIVDRDSLLDIDGFPINQKNGEDLYVWMRLSQLGAVAYSSECLVSINQCEDESRYSRKGCVPYPIIYFSDCRANLSKSEKKYIFVLALKSLILNINDGNIDSQMLIMEKMKEIDVKYYSILYFIKLIPDVFIRGLIKYR
ncbi:glycosyltransferase family 2 protein [Vibrio vulnificus]|uniref:glycosyltransferase family 2 protein n=1 Tax=Vibrio vulnificus TaxID=672 RepID=UPI002FBE1D1D